MTIKTNKSPKSTGRKSKIKSSVFKKSPLGVPSGVILLKSAFYISKIQGNCKNSNTEAKNIDDFWNYGQRRLIFAFFNATIYKMFYKGVH